MIKNFTLQNRKIFFHTKFIILFSLMINFPLFSQTPSVVKNIRIPLWAELDAYPELEIKLDENEGQYAYPKKEIKEVAPFLINGMVYGWTFSYTPSDKMRNVEEILEVTEIMDVSVIENQINYASAWIENNRLNYWCEYKRTEGQIQNYHLWNSIQNPMIHGRGYGQLSDGFEGIKNAAKEALKDAIRQHYRAQIKNKPKEITGSVLIRDLPTLGITSGRYVINLDFFLEYGKIIEYTVY